MRSLAPAICRGLLGLALLTLAAIAIGCASNPYLNAWGTGGQTPEADTITIIDRYPEGPEALEPTALPRRNPCAESNHYGFIVRGARWRTFPVTYRIAEGPVVWQQAVNRALNTWDAQFPGSFFAPDAASLNVFRWEAIDGPGRTVAVTQVTFDRRRGAFLQFEVVFDGAEDWAALGPDACPSAANTKLDLESVAAHEIGHVVGLGHVNGPTDLALTMYPTVRSGETFKRSLGLGDRSGFALLYNARR